MPSGGPSCRGPPAYSLRRKPVGKLGRVAFPGPGPAHRPATCSVASHSGLRDPSPGPAPRDPRDLRRGRRLQPSPRGAKKRGWARGAGRGAGTRGAAEAGRGHRLASAAFRGRLWRLGRATAPKQRAGGPRGGGRKMPRAGLGRQRPERIPDHAGTA